MEHELGARLGERVLDRGGVGDVEPLPFAAGVRVARRPRREVGRDDVVALRDERADQVVADLPAGSGDENFHAARTIQRAPRFAALRTLTLTST